MPKLLLTKSWLRSLSGLCVNLSAAWFATILVSSKFVPLDILLLTRTVSSGILFLLLSVEFEKLLEL